MSSMILLSGIELPVRAIHDMVASAIDVIVHVARFPDGSRKITGITEVIGITADQLDLKDIFVFEQTGITEDGSVMGYFKHTGYVPSFYQDFVMRGISLRKEIFSST